MATKSYGKWTFTALAAECSERGVEMRGRKHELVQRLEELDKADLAKRQRTDSGSTAEMLQSLECPVCFEYMMMPFQQCTNGHIICNKCMPRMMQGKCPTCRISLAQLSRNLMMERVAKSLTIPCKDCGVLVSYTSLKEHLEKDCESVKVPCPFQRLRCDYCADYPNMYTLAQTCTHRATPAMLVEHLTSEEGHNRKIMRTCRSGERFNDFYHSTSQALTEVAQSNSATIHWNALYIVTSNVKSSSVHVLNQVELTPRGLMMRLQLVDAEFPNATFTLTMENERGDQQMTRKGPLMPLSPRPEETATALRRSLLFPMEFVELCNCANSETNSAGKELKLRLKVCLTVSLGDDQDGSSDESDDDDDDDSD